MVLKTGIDDNPFCTSKRSSSHAHLKNEISKWEIDFSRSWCPQTELKDVDAAVVSVFEHARWRQATLFTAHLQFPVTNRSNCHSFADAQMSESERRQKGVVKMFWGPLIHNTDVGGGNAFECHDVMGCLMQQCRCQERRQIQNKTKLKSQMKWVFQRRIAMVITAMETKWSDLDSDPHRLSMLNKPCDK